MRRPLLVLLLASCLMTAAAPVAGAADTTTTILRDCQDEQIDGTYTQQQFIDALRAIATDVDEYTTCRDAIRDAQLAAAGGGSGGAAVGAPGASASGSGRGGPAAGSVVPSRARRGGSATELLGGASPVERRAVETARTGGAARAGTLVGGRMIAPIAAVNAVPTPLVVVLLLLALSLLATGLHTLRSRLRGRRTT